MKVNKKLLPIKSHYFLFMAAMGPILPQLPVYGKEMGISTVVMGLVTGILPFAFLVAKPLFGLLVDIYRDFRKTIFMMLILTMTLSFALIAFIPVFKSKNQVVVEGTVQDYFLDTCKSIAFNETNCKNSTKSVMCTSACFHHPDDFLITVCDVDGFLNTTDDSILKLCSPDNETYPFLVGNRSCPVKCTESVKSETVLYHSIIFWSFFILMSVGTIAFNVANSISDAICFDVIGKDYDYGKQRVWGTIGFGATALISGYIVDFFSEQSRISYTPAIAVMIIFSFLDILCCFKLKLPVIEAPKNLFKDIGRLLNNRHVITFMAYAVLVGVLDGFIIYFLFWYVEDLAASTDIKNIKLIEGLVVAAETLGGEVIFFSMSGKILQRFGHVHCFSMCFINYGLRLGLISLAPNPWWVLPVEFVFQGPTYALTYTTVVAYANELAPHGASATMQGIAAGMDDGVGYAFGSILGGILYNYIGGKYAFQAFSCLAILCSISHLILHKTYLKHYEAPVSLDWKDEVIYKSPEVAAKILANITFED